MFTDFESKKKAVTGYAEQNLCCAIHPYYINNRRSKRREDVKDVGSLSVFRNLSLANTSKNQQYHSQQTTAKNYATIGTKKMNLNATRSPQNPSFALPYRLPSAQNICLCLCTKYLLLMPTITRTNVEKFEITLHQTLLQRGMHATSPKCPTFEQKQ